MLVGVLSALARMDVDPWQEASDLARFPLEAATQRLASLIAALPDALPSHLDPRTIAGRLITLLPRRALAKIPSREMMAGVRAVTNARVLTFVIILAIMLGAQYIWPAVNRWRSSAITLPDRHQVHKFHRRIPANNHRAGR